MRISIPSKQAYHLINHGPCNLMTSGDGARKNVAPINWTMPLNNDPAQLLTVLEAGIFTEKLVSETGEFVVNLAGEPLAEVVLNCGRYHGNLVDKFEKFNLTPVPSKR